MRSLCKFISISASVLVAAVLTSILLANSLLLFQEMGSDGTPSNGFGASTGSEPGRFEFHLDANGNDLGGTSTLSSATVIRWRSEFYSNSQGATVLEVVKAAADRMQRLQKTPQASDKNARALWELRKAIDIMEGREVSSTSLLGDAQ